MRRQQRTIAEPASLSGTGLHTGNPSTISFHPAPENYGLRFVRTDLEGAPEVPADVDLVTDISRGTTLTKDGVSVHTVEHVLSALVGLEVDNCRVELTANEPPIGDGSALPFTEALVEAGFADQKAPRQYIAIEQMIDYKNEERGVEIVALPNDEFRVTVMIDYRNPALGSQHSGLFSMQEFATEFAPARTFCFLTEVEMLRREGLIKGGSLDNAIVIVDKEINQNEVDELSKRLGLTDSVVLGSTGVLNNGTMRFTNEPARHKLLDMLGDLALIGAPMKAHVLAARPGHASNIEFARKIKRLAERKKLFRKFNIDPDGAGPVLDVNAIMKILPHRYPFLLVDRILELDTDAGRIVGLKNVTINEPFFNGHFPGQPIMPGVLIVEAMAQTGGMLLLNHLPADGSKLAFFMGIREAKFRKPVVPGDQIRFEVTLKSKRFNTFALGGKAFVEGTLVAEADVTVAMVDRGS